MQIGKALSFARQGQKVAVQLPNGRVKKFIAATDIVSSTVLIVGDVAGATPSVQVISQDVAQLQLTRTTQFFESKTNYEEGGEKWAYLFEVIEREDEILEYTNPTWYSRFQGNIVYPTIFYELGDGGGSFRRIEDLEFYVDTEPELMFINNRYEFQEVQTTLQYNDLTIDSEGRVISPLYASNDARVFKKEITIDREQPEQRAFYQLGISPSDLDTLSINVDNYFSFHYSTFPRPYGNYYLSLTEDETELRKKRNITKLTTPGLQPNDYYVVREFFVPIIIRYRSNPQFIFNNPNFGCYGFITEGYSYIPDPLFGVFKYPGIIDPSMTLAARYDNDFPTTTINFDVTIDPYDGIIGCKVTMSCNMGFYEVYGLSGDLEYTKDFLTGEEEFFSFDYSSYYFYQQSYGSFSESTYFVSGSELKDIYRTVANSVYADFLANNTFYTPSIERIPLELKLGSEILSSGVRPIDLPASFFTTLPSIDAGRDSLGVQGRLFWEEIDIRVEIFAMPKIPKRTPGKRQIYCQVEDSKPLLLKEIPLAESFDSFISPIPTGLEVVIKTGKKGLFSLPNQPNYNQLPNNNIQDIYPDVNYYNRDWGVVEVYKISPSGTLIEPPKRYSSLDPNNDVIDINYDNWQKDWVFSYKDHKSIKDNIPEWRYDIFNNLPLLQEAAYFYTGELPGRDVNIDPPKATNHLLRSLVGEKAVPIIRAIDPITYYFTEEAAANGGSIDIYMAYTSSSFISCGTMLKDKSFIVIFPFDLIDKEDQENFSTEPSSVTIIDSTSENHTEIKDIDPNVNKSITKALLNSNQVKKRFYEVKYFYNLENNTFSVNAFLEKSTTFPKLRKQDLNLQNPESAEKEMGFLAICQF